MLRLLKTAQDYLTPFPATTQIAASLIDTDNYEGCLKTIAQQRDTLANADYRLHDVMNMILQLLKTREEAKTMPRTPAAKPASQVSPPHPKPAAKKQAANSELDPVKVQDRMQEVRENIKNLGLQVPEEQLQEIMRKANDKAS